MGMLCTHVGHVHKLKISVEAPITKEFCDFRWLRDEMSCDPPVTWKNVAVQDSKTALHDVKTARSTNIPVKRPSATVNPSLASPAPFR